MAADLTCCLCTTCYRRDLSTCYCQDTVTLTGVQIIRIKIREQFVRIIHTSKSMGKHMIMQITIARIIRDVRISEGQIIRAILYFFGWQSIRIRPVGSTDWLPACKATKTEFPKTLTLFRAQTHLDYLSLIVHRHILTTCRWSCRTHFDMSVFTG